VDSAGNAYVTGETNSSDFPTLVGPYTSYRGGGYDAFVAKVNPSGTALVYSGFLGGAGEDSGHGIAVDSAGNAYVTGYTESSNFPATVGPYTSYQGGGYDAFVAKVTADGTGLVYSGFLGGSGYDEGYGIAVDSAGNAYVTGETQSSDFPALGSWPYKTYHDNGDAFVAKVNPSGTGLVYSGFLGGSYTDWGYGIAVDSAGNAYVTGGTQSSDFPTQAPWPYTSYHGGYYDAFVAKVKADGTGLAYSGFLGGSNNDGGASIAVDSAGNAYITGPTGSKDFPTSVGLSIKYQGVDYDAFVAEVKADGTDLIYSGFLGGATGIDWGYGIAVDSAGNAYVTGYTTSSDFPAQGPWPYTSYQGGYDAFVAKIKLSGGVTGTVRDSAGQPLAGVTISDGAGHSATTGADGTYILSDLPAGPYTLTASKSGYTFSPASRTVTVPPDASGQDFTGVSNVYLPFVRR